MDQEIREHSFGIIFFFQQLNSVWEDQFQRLEAVRPRGPGCGAQGPVLRMAGPPPPWACTAVLLCALSLSGAIEIPMDRESPVHLESADWGQRSRGSGEGRESEDRSEKVGTAEAVASGFRAEFSSRGSTQASSCLGTWDLESPGHLSGPGLCWSLPGAR